jgi:uncharacterized membrane protein
MRSLAVPSRVVLLCFLALCLFVVSPPGVAAADHHADGIGSTGQNPIATTGQNPSATTGQDLSSIDIGDSQDITIRLEPDGDAVITVSFVFENQETEAQRSAFRKTATEFERSESVWPFFNNTVQNVTAHTGRPMSLEGPRRMSRLDRERDVGVLTVRLTWHQFAKVSNGSIVAEDAFYVDDRTPWIKGLLKNQRLIIVGPEGYSLTGAPDGPKFDDDRIIWTGEHRFEQGDLRTTWSRNGTSLLTSALVGAGIVLVVIAVLYGAWRLSSRSEPSVDTPSGPPSEPITDTDGGAPARSSSEGTSERPRDVPSTPDPSTQTPDDPTSDPSEDTAAASAGATTSAQNSTSAPDSDSESAAEDASDTATESTQEIDRELLSDEELVERMLDQNGGRMKQANIVKETGWSNAKVSQLLSEMDENDRVDKLRIGRENLISLPDEDVTTLE